MAKTARAPRQPNRASEVRTGVLHAMEACDAKKATDVALLELEKDSGAFTDYFIICSGSNPRQIQAISDEVEQRLEDAGLRSTHVEGYSQADWVLLDYVDFVVHVFSEGARKFYDLERLWKSARRITAAELQSPSRARKAPSKAKTAAPAKSGAKARATSSPRRAATKRRSTAPSRRRSHK